MAELVEKWLKEARKRTAEGELRAAASLWDRLYGLQPEDLEIRARRSEVLDKLARREFGMVFRYIPAGPFLMGSADGDPDEAPVHERDVGDFWLCETPLSLLDYIYAWSGELLAYEDFLTWRAGRSDDDAAGQVNDYMAFRLGGFLASHFDSSWRSRLFQRRRVWSYWSGALEPDGEVTLARDGKPLAEETPAMAIKPFAGLTAELCNALAEHMSSASLRFALPGEAEWEKAARGGLIGAPYPWGWEADAPNHCDCEAFARYGLLPSKHFPANGYGLYAMSGSVWELTSELYHARAYSLRTQGRKEASTELPRSRVIRGGSWADDREACRVSFRGTLGDPTYTDRSAAVSVGARLALYERSSQEAKRESRA